MASGVTYGSIFWWIGYLAGMVDHPEGEQYQGFVQLLTEDNHARLYLQRALDGLQRALNAAGGSRLNGA